MKKTLAIAAALALLCLCTLAQANITIATVPVGNAGNAADTTSGFGAVNYNYNIGEYDVTAGQYTAFLNAVAATDTYGCYSTPMSTDCGISQIGSPGSYSYAAADANLPVVDVSYWDSCRFANWLDNGQGDGSTETGAYTLNGYNGTDAYAGIKRNAGAAWAVTSENEWYKAAYYDPALNGGTGGYYEYATQSNTAPTACGPTSAANCANYNNAVGSTTDVGAYTGSASHYGTYDQNGNVWEWDEAIPYISGNYAYRGQRGGSFDYSNLQEAYGISLPTYSSYNVGFRVSEVPEPSSIIALLGGLTGLLGIRRRSKAMANK